MPLHERKRKPIVLTPNESIYKPTKKVIEKPIKKPIVKNYPSFFTKVENGKMKNSEYSFEAIYGDVGTGKSSYALSYPEPIFYIDVEDGIKKIVENFKHRDIRYINLLNDSKEIVEATGKIYTKVQDKIEVDGNVLFNRLAIVVEEIIKLCQENAENVGTVVIDDYGYLYVKAQAWRDQSYAQFMDDEKAYRHSLGLEENIGKAQSWDNAKSWSKTNSLILNPIDLLKSQSCNLVVISKVKKKDSKVEGVEIVIEHPNWSKHTEGLADNVLHFNKDSNGKFSAIIKKVRVSGVDRYYNKSLDNTRFRLKYDTFKKEIGEKQ